jgi:hypothetical protein
MVSSIHEKYSILDAEENDITAGEEEIKLNYDSNGILPKILIKDPNDSPNALEAPAIKRVVFNN